jgi:hypothetical protein
MWLHHIGRQASSRFLRRRGNRAAFWKSDSWSGDYPGSAKPDGTTFYPAFVGISPAGPLVEVQANINLTWAG